MVMERSKRGGKRGVTHRQHEHRADHGDRSGADAGGHHPAAEGTADDGQAIGFPAAVHAAGRAIAEWQLMRPIELLGSVSCA